MEQPMTQTPAGNAKPPIQAHPDALPAAPPADVQAPLRVQPREDGLLVDANDLLSRRVTRPRLCVLCGGPLLTGQHMLRVHGTTVHARCSQSR
jgi:hypothetical protein